MEELTPYQKWQMDRYGDVLPTRPDYPPADKDGLSVREETILLIENEQLYES